MIQSLFPTSRYVCNIDYFLRARLLLFMYSNLSTSEWLKLSCKMYCFVAPIVLAYDVVSHLVYVEWNSYICLYWCPRMFKFLLSIWYTLYTGDSYITNSFLGNPLTDITLDSPRTFSKLEKFIKCLYFFINFIKIFEIVLSYFLWSRFILTWSFIRYIILELHFNHCLIEKALILGLLNSRLIVLRKKLGRYGFRKIRDAKFGQKVYSEMYLGILKGFHAISKSLKLLMTIDMTITSVQIIGFIVAELVYDNGIRNHVRQGEYLHLAYTAILLLHLYASISLQCFLMETAAGQVEAMRTYVVTELIKYPSARERCSMLDFLELTEAAPAQFTLCRALRVDARFALTFLIFCTSQVIAFVQVLGQH